MPEGPLGFPRFTSIGPMVKERSLIAELDSAIGDEKSARTEYQRLIDLLERDGFGEQANIVRQIQQDEVEHRNKLKRIRQEVMRRR